MNRVLIIVEGPTERAVMEQVLAPNFGNRNIFLHAKVLGTPGHKGGIRSFQAIRKEVSALLNQERCSFVSTFFDFYGLPTDWPGIDEAHGKRAQEKARIVEAAMLENVRPILVASDNLKRFLPYVQMHELEALLFSNPKVMASAFEPILPRHHLDSCRDLPLANHVNTLDTEQPSWYLRPCSVAQHTCTRKGIRRAD